MLLKRSVSRTVMIKAMLLAMALVFAGASSLVAEEPLLVVTRPTVIAFFPPVTEKMLAEDPDTNEALADFQVYAERVREPLLKAGVEFQEVYARAFRIRIGNRVRVFRPGKVEIGYYFVSPTKKAAVEYGVETDFDLFVGVQKHLGITVAVPEAVK